MNIFEALDRAAELREQSAALRREADELEQEWVGVASEEILTVRRLVEVIRKVGEATP